MNPFDVAAWVGERLVVAIPDPFAVYDIEADHTNPPCAVIRPSDDGPFIDPWGTFGDSGLCEAMFTVTVVVPFVDDRTAYRQIGEYLSTGAGNERSIFQALQNNRLGDRVAYVHVIGIAAPAPRAFGDARYLAADIPIRVCLGRN